MKISAILYGFFFAVIYSIVDKPRSIIFIFAGVLVVLVVAEKMAENLFAKSENRLPAAKAIICYGAFITLRLLGLEGVYKPPLDIVMTFVVAILPAVLVYFVVRYQVRHETP